MKGLIIKLAETFDKLGQIKKADRLDMFLQKYAEEEDREPTPEELFEEEEWLKKEYETQSFDDQLSEDEWLKDEPLAGLEGDDLKSAELYLQGMDPAEIKQYLIDIKKEQQEILKQLSLLLSEKDSSPDMLPHQMPITPEASLRADFKKLADILDSNKLYKHADVVDKILTKMAQGLPPDDFDGDDLDFDDDDIEPTTDELMKIDSEYENRFLDVIQSLADGVYSTLEDAQDAAREALKLYDAEFGVPEKEEQDLELDLGPEPDNVLKFPKQ
jgi:hypothetical protein